MNRRLLDLFAERRLFHKLGSGERWRVGEQLIITADCEIEPYCQFNFGQVIPRRVGAFSYANSQFPTAPVSVGRYASIGQRTLWMGAAHAVDWATTSPFCFDPFDMQGVKQYLVDRQPTEPFKISRLETPPIDVTIGNDVWIADEVAIKRGVTIGDGAIVGARAVVTRDVPPCAVVVGSPARVVRMRFAEAVVERYLALKWWRFGPDVLQPMDVTAPEAFLDRVEEAIAAGVPELALTPLTYPEMKAAAGAL